VCVELGEQLAATARRKLAAFPNVSIVNAPFETWQPEDGRTFDAVAAFTAFHWVEPELRYEKSAALLRDGGTLIVVATKHVLPAGGDAFWVDVQKDYDAVVPSDENAPPPAPEDVPDLSAEVDGGGVFRTIAARRYLWEVNYDADQYIAVLDTYSGHRTLDESTRLDLYYRIRRRIEARPQRSVRKTYLAALNVARRL
jgi:hypothetical protein